MRHTQQYKFELRKASAAGTACLASGSHAECVFVVLLFLVLPPSIAFQSATAFPCVQMGVGADYG
jgi:hypothetical protein